MTRSHIFAAYNMARPLAKRGQLDAGRLNRALGIAISNKREHISRYHTTKHTCTCPDFAKRHRICKGVLAVQLLEVAESLAR